MVAEPGGKEWGWGEVAGSWRSFQSIQHILELGMLRECVRGDQPLMPLTPIPRPLHIAVVQANLPAVHRLVNLFQHGGRELDIYNNLRQVRLGLGARSPGTEGGGAGVLHPWV